MLFQVALSYFMESTTHMAKGEERATKDFSLPFKTLIGIPGMLRAKWLSLLCSLHGNSFHKCWRQLTVHQLFSSTFSLYM